MATDTTEPSPALLDAPAAVATAAAPTATEPPFKFDVKHGDLMDALGIAMRAVPAKSTLPVLTNVLIEHTQDGRVDLTGNNLDLGIRVSMPAVVLESGAITVPAKLLYEYAAELSKHDSVRFTLNPKTHKIALVSGQYKANISTITAEDFPPIPVATGDRYVLPGRVLRRAIGLSAYAAATDDTRPVLAGVLIRMDAGTLTMAASDGFRLAAISSPYHGAERPLSVTVKADTMRIIERLLPDDSDSDVTMTVASGGSGVMFSTDTVDLTGRVIDGPFPDYERVIPNAGIAAVVKTSDMLRAVRAAGVMARSNSNIIRLNVMADRIEVASTSAEMGDSAAEVDARVTGGTITMGLNGRYVTDVLELCETEQAQFEFTDTSKPIIIRQIDKNDVVDQNITSVVMPMIIQR